MYSLSQRASIILAVFFAAGNTFAETEQRASQLPAGCTAEKLNVDTGLLDPFTRVNTAEACSASSMVELNALKAKTGSTSLCVHTYQDLFELSKNLKKQLASTGADLTSQKIDCDKSPAECKSFYAETIGRLKQGHAAEDRAQSAVQNLLARAKTLLEANAVPQGATKRV